MPKSRKRTQKPIGFESLENRALLAGDVSVNVVNGLLLIRGDEAANLITVKQSVNAWTVQGQSTLVNGSTAIQRFANVTDIAIELRGGNDRLNLQNGTLTGALGVDAGKGTNSVSIVNINAGDIDLRSEDGSDAFSLNNVESDTRLRIRTYFFSTRDLADTVSISNSSAGEDLEIVTGGGNDSVTVNNSEAIASVSIRTLAGNDTVRIDDFSAGEELSITTAEGNDSVTISDAECGTDLSISTGATTSDGNDSVSVSKFLVGDFVEISTGNGSDRVAIADLEAVGAELSTSTTTADGNDTVTVNRVLLEESFEIYTGNGADIVSLNLIEVGIDLTLITWESLTDLNDTVRMSFIEAGNDIFLETGNGTDSANLNAVLAVDTIDCQMQGGINDRLVVTQSEALLALFNGGGNPGDRLLHSDNLFGLEVDTGFAIIT